MLTESQDIAMCLKLSKGLSTLRGYNQLHSQSYAHEPRNDVHHVRSNEARVTVDDLRKHLVERFADEEFVKVLEKGVALHTRHVRGSNYCLLNVFEDRISGRAIIISVIDNLVKGASGQALQNLNLMMGYPEECGLLQQPLFP